MLLKSSTVGKIKAFSRRINGSSGEVARALVAGGLTPDQYREMFAKLQSDCNELEKVYNVMKKQVASQKGVEAVFEDAQFDELLGEIVSLATRIDVLQDAVKSEAGDDLQPEPDDASAEDIIEDLNPEEKTEEGCRAEDAPPPAPEVAPEEEEKPEEEVNLAPAEITSADDIQEDLEPHAEPDGDEAPIPEEAPEQEEEACGPKAAVTPKQANRVQTKVRSNLTATKSSEGFSLKNLWNFNK